MKEGEVERFWKRLFISSWTELFYALLERKNERASEKATRRRRRDREGEKEIRENRTGRKRERKSRRRKKRTSESVCRRKQTTRIQRRQSASIQLSRLVRLLFPPRARASVRARHIPQNISLHLSLSLLLSPLSLLRALKCRGRAAVQFINKDIDTFSRYIHTQTRERASERRIFGLSNYSAVSRGPVKKNSSSERGYAREESLRESKREREREELVYRRRRCCCCWPWREKCLDLGRRMNRLAALQKAEE